MLLVQCDLNSGRNVVLNEDLPGSYSINMRVDSHDDYLKDCTSRDIKKPQDGLDAISWVLQTFITTDGQ